MHHHRRGAVRAFATLAALSCSLPTFALDAVPDAALPPPSYYLEIRYCTCADRTESSPSLTPSDALVAQTRAITLGVNAQDDGFVTVDGLTFRYALAPGQSPGLAMLQFDQEYIQGSTSTRSEGRVDIPLDTWITLAVSRHTGTPGEGDFTLIARLGAAAPTTSAP